MSSPDEVYARLRDESDILLPDKDDIAEMQQVLLEMAALRIDDDSGLY